METRNSGRGEIASVLAQYPAVGDREIDGHHYEVVTSYASPLPANDTNHAWVGRTLPGGLVEFWSQISSAVLLFSEGSDGLRILTPGESRTITDRISVEHEVGEEFFHENDFIVGQFQGYDWLLVFSPGEGWMVTGESGDRRENWVHLGENIIRFLQVFLQVDGTDGYWVTPFFDHV